MELIETSDSKLKANDEGSEPLNRANDFKKVERMKEKKAKKKKLEQKRWVWGSNHHPLHPK